MSERCFKPYTATYMQVRKHIGVAFCERALVDNTDSGNFIKY